MIYCEKCKLNFEGKLWESGQCPQCGDDYFWDEESGFECVDGEIYETDFPVVCWERDEAQKVER